MLCQTIAQCPPPSRFVPAIDVKFAKIISVPPFIKHKRYHGRRLEGIKYERKAQEYLSQIDDCYIPGFWLSFLAGGNWRYCQPDGIRIDIQAGRITVVEIKSHHTSDAWWQVTQLYKPVLTHLFPEELWTYDYCEVVKWYDPDTLFPAHVHLVADPFRPSSDFKVHIWKP